MKETLIQTLKRAKKEVSRWPKWKREALGKIHNGEKIMKHIVCDGIIIDEDYLTAQNIFEAATGVVEVYIVGRSHILPWEDGGKLTGEAMETLAMEMDGDIENARAEIEEFISGEIIELMDDQEYE